MNNIIAQLNFHSLVSLGPFILIRKQNYISLLTLKASTERIKIKQTLTLFTLIDGNIFWNIVAINLKCIPSPLKLFKTNKGWWENSFSYINGFFCEETISFTSEYSFIWKVRVGPLGSFNILKYILVCDFVKITRWETFNGPAIWTKSLTTLCFWT